MNNTMQLYIDEKKEIKGYPITSPDRVIDENGVSIKEQFDAITSEKADNTTINNLQAQINNLVINGDGTQNLEVIQARVGSDGQTYSTLNNNINAIATGRIDFNKSALLYGKTKLDMSISLLEMGHISGNTTPTSTTRVRSKDFITVPFEKNINVIVFDSNYKFWLIKYDEAGEFISSLGGYSTNTQFILEPTSKYKLLFGKKDNGILTVDEILKSFAVSVEGENDFKVLKDAEEMAKGNLNLENSPLKFGVLSYMKFENLQKRYWNGSSIVSSTVRAITNMIDGGKEYIFIDNDKKIKMWIHQFNEDGSYVKEYMKSYGESCDGIKFKLESGFKYRIQFGYIDNSVIDLDKFKDEILYRDVNSTTINDLINKFTDKNTVSTIKPFVESIAHQGYSYVYPLSTEIAFIGAGKHGFTHIEADIKFTKDNIPVLCHNTTIDATSNGTGTIKEMTYEELLTYDFGSWKSPEFAGEKICTFDTMVKTAKIYGMGVYLDQIDSLDTVDKYDLIVSILKKYGMLKNFTWLIGSATYTLEHIKRVDPTGHIMFTISSLNEDLKNKIMSAKTSNPTNKISVGIDVNNLIEDDVLWLRENEIGTYVWTIDDKNKYLQWLPFMDGVTSNRYKSQDVI